MVEVQVFLGHTSVAQTATYFRSSPKALESAIERKDAYEQQLVDARREPPSAEIGSPLMSPVLSLGPDRIQ